MMRTPAQADLQRWSDEVARDPRSLAFLPLARAYRRQGLREPAQQLLLRGLTAYPHHVEAHGLLAMLHLDAGDHQRAADEWSMVLRLDPDNFDALRGLGFYHLERDELSRARTLLERALVQRPGDAAVQGALHELGTRQQLQERGLGPAAHHGDDPWATAPAPAEEPRFMLAAAADEAPAVPAPPAAPAQAAAPVQAAAPAARAVSAMALGSTDPTALFDALLTGPLQGALLVDEHGLVLAGRLTGTTGDADALGAVLGGALGEAARTAGHLGLGDWRGILLESDDALLHLRPLRAGSALILAAQRHAPAGWLLRTSAQAADHAARYLESYG